MLENYYIDAIILFLFLMGTFMGYRKGLFRQIISITGFIIAYIFASAFSQSLIPFVEKVVPYSLDFQFYYKAISFAIIFIVTKILLTVLAKFIQSIFKGTIIQKVDGLGGATLGFFEAYFTITLLVIALGIVPILKGGPIVEQSIIAKKMVEITPFLVEQISQFIF